MSYFLGVDLGTTYSAAATRRGDHTAISALSDRSPMVPSVLLLRDDDSILVGDAANRRAVVEPDRVAREFKRRFGDPAPLIVGGSPYGADLLTARLLRWVVDLVAEREGGMPDGIALTHPANWGNYKLDLLHQAVRRADLHDGAPCVTLSEPRAAATWYARYERVEPGTVVAVYDLGGGTFDAAVLRRTADGFDLLGTPEGIERLGGIDFDAAVFDHVVATLGDAWDALDEDDPQVRAAVARLRQECVEAKEALSGDSQASIPVVLPGLHTDVRLTRSEFEAMVRPTLADTVVALRRALRSAELEPEEVDKVLLVGGSSRIPLVAEVVGAELGRPIAVDAHPKHAVALGAAVARLRQECVEAKEALSG
ncbi:MAG: Hsp70 family protein, partial [Acidimicrobiales bacterium]